MPIDSGRSVLEEINTMEGFGIGSKVVKPVSNYERDGLTDGSCAVTRTLDRRKNRDEITRELGQPPRDHYRFAYTLCPIRVDCRWLQCAHDTRRSIFRWLLLTERTSRRVVCVRVFHSVDACLLSRRGRNCRLCERIARKRLHARLLLNIREPVDGNVYDLSLDSMRENWCAIPITRAQGVVSTLSIGERSLKNCQKKIGYFSIKYELSVGNWMWNRMKKNVAR